jgi:putative transposase
MDFIHDELATSGKIRMLILVDKLSRESLAIEVNSRLRLGDVVDVLERLKCFRGLPETLCSHRYYGSEFTSRSLDEWAYINRVKLHFIKPGKPTENAHIESFNERLRDECLNVHLFGSQQDAREKIEAWRIDYNNWRPHSFLGYLTPREFARRKMNKQTTC